MDVVFRVDGGARMGSGHVMRCLTLAEELRRRGASIRFISRERPGDPIARIEAAGFDVYRLPALAERAVTQGRHQSWLGVTQDQDAQETLEALRGQGADWLVIDHYGIDAAWQVRVRPMIARLLVVDDLADRHHQADLLVDQNFVGARTETRYEGLVEEGCQQLLGPRYALLRPIYRHLRGSMPARDGSVRRVLVFFGAHDMSGSLLKVLRVLGEDEFAGLALDVVAGNDPKLLASVRDLVGARFCVTVHEMLPTLAALMTRADLAIGASGATTWERACLGLPAIVATVADNQVEIAKALEAHGSTVCIGAADGATEGDWRGALRTLLADGSRMAAMECRARSLTDGHGAARVAFSMYVRRVERLTLRLATAVDEWLLLDWANDPEARARSFGKVPISTQQHHAWFAASLRDPNCMILIGEDEYGLPLGQVRFNTITERREAVVSINVERVARGRGVGKDLLRSALTRWLERRPDLTLIAEVLEENDASRALFLGCGFVQVAARRPGSCAYAYRP